VLAPSDRACLPDLLCGAGARPCSGERGLELGDLRLQCVDLLGLCFQGLAHLCGNAFRLGGRFGKLGLYPLASLLELCDLARRGLGRHLGLGQLCLEGRRGTLQLLHRSLLVEIHSAGANYEGYQGSDYRLHFVSI